MYKCFFMAQNDKFINEIVKINTILPAMQGFYESIGKKKLL